MRYREEVLDRINDLKEADAAQIDKMKISVNGKDREVGLHKVPVESNAKKRLGIKGDWAYQVRLQGIGSFDFYDNEKAARKMFNSLKSVKDVWAWR